MSCVTTEADEHASIAILVRRTNETLTQLLTRLDHAIGIALTEDVLTDEVNSAPRAKRTPNFILVVSTSSSSGCSQARGSLSSSTIRRCSR